MSDALDGLLDVIERAIAIRREAERVRTQAVATRVRSAEMRLNAQHQRARSQALRVFRHTPLGDPTPTGPYSP